jgi:hypothetical protein
MARGQDAPLRTGGQIDPYVAASMQQGRQLSENRLVSAMQEAGATTRAKRAEAGATQRTAMQIQAQQNMQAADLAAQDKRAAEAEKARRDDQKFAITMQESGQAFQAEQAKLQRDYDDAVRNKEWDRADKIYEQIEAARRFDYELDLDAQDRTTNAILSMTKIGFQREQAREKAITTLYKSREDYERDKEIYDTTIQRTVDGFGTDKRIDQPIPGTLEPPKPPSKLKTIGLSALGMVPEKYLEETQEYAKKLRTVEYADPLGVMQSQLNRTGSPISIEDLSPINAVSLESDVANNKIQAQDIRNTAAVIEGTLQFLDSRISETPAGKEVSFWKNTKAKVIRMRDTLENLRRSNRKIATNGNETVGVRAKTAFGITGTSLGSRISSMKSTLGTEDYGAILDELTKPLTVPSLKPVTTKMSPYERQLREQYNAILLRKYPELGGAR